MVSKIVKYGAILLIVGGIVWLTNKFPDQMVLIIGIGLILLLASWWLEMEHKN